MTTNTDSVNFEPSSLEDVLSVARQILDGRLRFATISLAGLAFSQDIRQTMSPVLAACEQKGLSATPNSETLILVIGPNPGCAEQSSRGLPGFRQFQTPIPSGDRKVKLERYSFLDQVTREEG